VLFQTQLRRLPDFPGQGVHVGGSLIQEVNDPSLEW